MVLAAVIPKVHLHCHLEGSLRSDTFVELADRHGVPLRYDPAGRAPRGGEVDRADPYRFADFPEFLLTFAAVSRALADPDDYGRLAREFVADALAQNVVYGELFVSPSVWTFFHPALDVRAAFGAIAAELRAAAPKAEFRLIVDLTRNFGFERAMETAKLATTLTEFGVVAVGLGGDEARFPPGLTLNRSRSPARPGCAASRTPAKPPGRKACAPPSRSWAPSASGTASPRCAIRRSCGC